MFAGCAEAPDDSHAIDEPVTVEEIPGSDAVRLILDAAAAERIGIEMVPVERMAATRDEPVPRVVPYGAVLYHPTGETFVYTSPEPLVFVREDIVVERIDGSSAVLTASPSVGTPVVTVGGAELLGVEFGVGK